MAVEIVWIESMKQCSQFSIKLRKEMQSVLTGENNDYRSADIRFDEFCRSVLKVPGIEWFLQNV